MSVVTLEQETLAVMTELADEEISGIVGGGRGSVDIDTKAKIDVKAKGGNVQVSNQVGVAIAIGGGDAKVIQKSNQGIDNSRDRVRF
ncbi:MAG: hypothetical protein RM368_00335 [Nostoc sp. DedSLP03]|uniref:hypothetical protein n=1 Tax=Nostoc sp. DedSLP03 TaxID=3075400 RepID=UPI002AD3D5F2|nr:hypothetical protein [Nostoc sp. DedSLP03]MDZ7963419.1 hypothetical protein [Nostoc sp. DedSLP03]